MRLVMVSKVRDEADILETNLRYHAARGVDFFVVIDNGSTDGTVDILREWEASGRLHMIARPNDAFHREQQDWVTEMAQLAASEHDADWVLHNDADEFWWPLRGSLREALEGIPEEAGVVVVPRYDFVGRPDGAGSFAERLIVRDTHTPIVPKVAHRARADLFVYSGGHIVDLEVARRGEQGYSRRRTTYKLLPKQNEDPPPRDPLALAPTFPIRIFHFPLRSSAQYEKRLRVYFDGGYAPGVVGILRERFENEGIDALYAELAFDDDQVATGLRDGELVEDTRLRDFLARLEDGAAPDGPEPHTVELETEAHEVRLDALAGLGRSQRLLLNQRDQARAEALELKGELKRLRRSLRRDRGGSRWRRLWRR